MAEHNFPLLKPHPIGHEMGLLYVNDPLFWGELTRLQNLADRIITAKRRKKQRQLLASDLRNIIGYPGTTKEIIAALNKTISETLNFIRSAISQLPPLLVQFTESINPITSLKEKDFIELLIQWRELERHLLEEGDATIKLLEFEARRLLVLTLIIFHLNLHKNKLYLIADPVQEIEEYLHRRFFDKAPLTHRTIVSIHDPENEFRVQEWHFSGKKAQEAIVEIDPDLVRRTQMRCFQFTYDGKTHLVSFSYRTKTVVSHLLKMLRKDIRDPYSSALDWRGIKFVFFDYEGFQAGLGRLRENVFPLPAVTWKLGQGGFFKENSFSSEGYRAKKFITTLFGESVEVIAEDLISHLNGMLSHGEENHYHYRQRQLVGSALPRLFPKDIYGIDWKSAAKKN